jgi:hypothetical protein
MRRRGEQGEVTGERERERENKTIKKILFKENEEWNKDYCLNVFKKIVC